MIAYSRYCSMQGKLKGIKPKFSSRCTFLWIWFLRRDGFNQLWADFQPRKYPLLLEHVARKRGAMLTGRLAALRVITPGSSARLWVLGCATAYEECLLQAGTDAPSLPESPAQISTTADQRVALARAEQVSQDLESCFPSVKCLLAQTSEQSSRALSSYCVSVPLPQWRLHIFLSISPRGTPRQLSCWLLLSDNRWDDDILTGLTSFSYQDSFTSTNNFFFFCSSS